VPAEQGDARDEAIAALRKIPGVNGMYTLMTCMRWWYEVDESTSEDWTETMKGVCSVLQELNGCASTSVFAQQAKQLSEGIRAHRELTTRLPATRLLVPMTNLRTRCELGHRNIRQVLTSIAGMWTKSRKGPGNEW
jgi:hypothetical protein